MEPSAPPISTIIPNISSSKDGVQLSILQGSKLFNTNSPFIINITSPDIDEKKSNVDLICVIDVSGSMDGLKISYVKESMKTLIKMMDKNDRIAIVLFNGEGKIFLDLSYLTDDNKTKFMKDIEEIDAYGGTNVLSGLEKAVQILKYEKMKEEEKENKNKKEKEKENENKNINSNRVSTILLLSDGNDNNLNDVQIATGLKEMTKGLGLLFTLHTFGYGNDHDPKLMNRLATLRDGSFYYVDDLKKVNEYFVNVLGGCMSSISKLVDLEINIKDNGSKIEKVFGIENLFYHKLNEKQFKTKILQLISGKEYTFVMEVKLNEIIAINGDVISAKLVYENNENEKVETEVTYKYKVEIDPKDKEKADEEYIRSKVFDTLSEAMKLKDMRNNQGAIKLLDDMKKWIENNYNGKKKENFLKTIFDTYNSIRNERVYATTGKTMIASMINEGQFKRSGKTMSYTNSVQKRLTSSICP